MTAETMTSLPEGPFFLIKQNSKSCSFLHPFQFSFWLSSLCNLTSWILYLSIHEPCTFAEKLFKDRSIPGYITMSCTHSDFQFWLPVRRFHPCRRKVNDILMQKAIPDIRLSWFRVTVFISTETRKYKWYWQVDLTDCQNTCWTHTMAMSMHGNLDFCAIQKWY